ncbi:hypothetical protein N7454_009350 [Penicillium verhagenii]|nr:hypothetical protein N7454_009350 [Penicillium verhagenii]
MFAAYLNDGSLHVVPTSPPPPSNDDGASAHLPDGTTEEWEWEVDMDTVVDGVAHLVVMVTVRVRVSEEVVDQALVLEAGAEVDVVNHICTYKVQRGGCAGRARGPCMNY